MLFQHATKQLLAAYGPDAQKHLLEQFQQNEFNIQKLLIDICVLHAKMPDKLQLAQDTNKNR